MNETAVNPALVIVLTLLGIILFNLVLINWVRKRNADNQFKIFQNFIESAKNPWQQSDSELDQLSKLLNKINVKGEDEEIRKQDSISSDK